MALITGGASGIGECTARLFSKHGAKVVIADIIADKGHSVCKDLTNSSSSSASYVHCDVKNEKDIENAVNTAVSKYGKLDIMLNNAGITGVNKPNIVDNKKSEFEEVMIPARRGSIITTASVCGIIGGVASHAYTCSKHAVVGLTKNTAVELGQYGIRVNSVSP